MDINLTGQLWGMPINATLIGSFIESSSASEWNWDNWENFITALITAGATLLAVHITQRNEYLRAEQNRKYELKNILRKNRQEAYIKLALYLQKLSRQVDDPFEIMNDEFQRCLMDVRLFGDENIDHEVTDFLYEITTMKPDDFNVDLIKNFYSKILPLMRDEFKISDGA